MDADYKKFGKGPREHSGAVDLINHYKLLPHHEFFCKRSLPLSISETHYLRSVVGDTEIRKGEGMELDQLFHSTFYLRERNAGIHPFDLDILREAFQMRETTPVELSSAEKGIPTCVPKSKNEPKDKERKHKKSKDKAKDRKKHRHHPKDSSSDKNKDKCRIGNRDSGIEQKQQDKKRKHDGNGDVSYIQSHLKTERRNSQIKMGMQRETR